MASLRLLCSPAATCFGSEQQLSLVPPSSSLLGPHSISKSSQSHPSFSCSLSSIFALSQTRTLSLPSRTKRRSNFVFQLSSTAQEQVLESPPVTPANDDGEEAEPETEGFSKTRLIAQNVPWTSTHEDIRSLFEKYGTVLDVELSMYNKTKNRGLAFVSMGSPEEALAALKNLESYKLEGRTIKVDYARAKKKVATPVQPKPSVTFNLFVANLSYEARAKDLREFFNSEGSSVVSAEVIFHENPRRSLGYGFVAFKSKKEAEEALSNFQGKMFMGRPIRVARSKQFVKQLTEETKQSEDTANELNSGVEQAETANSN
ncbi:28 kDa ribonucleoprotein, chloroplastic [Ziziphus jujuba]|uniref:28 kDa ribonucleoprotein, chloroplastic n=1 Tax=Ziziphus jujuba TaxID=326968 RepID=A0A6P3ZUT0_ZIZJJ|nr:28 kDa ribonucleoprotein, chloroplastic [Ziziphus jujuba]XP_048331908.2 28 kDa ribonucleoprotein, chloroplastic [Ziziphus jujuba]